MIINVVIMNLKGGVLLEFMHETQLLYNMHYTPYFSSLKEVYCWLSII